MKRGLLSLLAVPVLLLASGCEEKPVQPPPTVVYPPSAPVPPPDLTPIGEGMKVIAMALVAVSVVAGAVILLRVKLQS